MVSIKCLRRRSYMIELNFLIDDYIDEFKQTKLYKDYYEITELVQTKYKDKTKELVDLKNKFDEVMKIGKFHPDFKEVASNYQKIRNDYYQNKDIVDRKSTRLNSSHVRISYAVFCLKKKKK